MKFKLPKIDLKNNKIEVAKTGLTVAGLICTLVSSHLDDLILDKKIKNEVISTIASLGKKKK